MRGPWVSALLVGFLLAVGGPAQAAAPGSPQNVAGSFNEDTQVLRLTWEAPPDAGQDPVDAYNIYQNGALLDDTTALSYEVPLSAAPSGAYVYTVKALRNGEESLPGGPVSIVKVEPPAGPLTCPPLATFLLDHFPFVEVDVREECVPV